jgi:release factor glutamine methyltransferase
VTASQAAASSPATDHSPGAGAVARATAAPVQPPPAGEPWTILHLIRWSTAYLTEKGVPSARLDVEHLLAHVMETERLQLYLRFEQPVTPAELARFRPLLLERARRRPLQYILGRAAFRDLELAVDGRVLIPRPETEELVDAVLRHFADAGASSERTSPKWARALDVGTGSGAIALSLAKEGPFDRVVASDASPAALEIARSNVSANALDGVVEVRLGDGLEVVEPGERFHVVVSNPPYVARADFDGLQAEVRLWEPAEALVAGEDGLALIRALVSGAGQALEEGGLLALEVGAGQAAAVAGLITAAGGFQPPRVVRDLRGTERIVLAVWSAAAPGAEETAR